ncbi:cytochrome c biogenesis protein CcdA [Macrococcoides bohemicum]|uniref:Cytochrome c biogenesis protein CcdA n=1 Tax=Macrococcoides bohemicum TaxID=1903056 RepID=A0A4R5Y1K7_9STAP|nr:MULTISPECIES: cytochrome c biogenesis protein CcdA [Macrococcus]MBC9873506.1 sulfite exporter TauE/SafE family protein [Macrococcus bohemicus]QRN49814.1 sulfite exporter TauE/SafE family protein [Macrococcus bohemicus]QYA41283.1 cytochrome c biogenesis protein CcdA [Macrococcus bohemicus]QYA43714.1 cytochrome c biogenesis protein CcdA [Macrococcus bohemicus]TDL37125.1 cytochrome c biogenesis protein CcdA [Macrococcus bohemicus]
MGDITIAVAFGAGILSFISPCVLPIYPAFLSYITGVSYNDLKDNKMDKKALLHTVFFLIGFSIVYISLGVGLGFVSDILQSYDNTIRMVGGLLCIIFGLVVLGIFNPQFLMKDRKFEFKNRPSGFIGTLLIGIAFAAGWTPCMGPIIGTIFSMAAVNQSLALIYMIAYVLGFCIPFFLLTFFITKINILKKYSQTITKIGGVMMIIMGLLLFFDKLTAITQFFS